MFQWQRLEHTGKRQIQGGGHLEEAILGNRCLAADPDAHLVLSKRLPNIRLGGQAGGRGWNGKTSDQEK